MLSHDLFKLLKQHWGYSQFRARQQAIVESILSGRDAAVVMPTGGGKSLCYQLPAVAMQHLRSGESFDRSDAGSGYAA